MNDNRPESLPPPPGVIGSLRAGFEAVSSHVVLILLPLALDVFLWLGPRLSVGDLYRSFIPDWIELNKRLGFPALDVQTLSERIDQLGSLNFLGGIRTLPIGIPSLLTGQMLDSLPMQTPLGLQGVIQVPSAVTLLGWICLLTLTGWIGGGLYFRWVSGTTLGDGGETGISPFRAVVQTLALSVIWTVGGMVILVPLALIVTVLVFLSPALANVAVLLLLIFSFWVVVPLFFMPHGIFVQKQTALQSMLHSLRMARFTLPTSSTFVFAVFVLSTGMNYLWSVPPGDSWMLLVGIAGHAFIATALLSASFVYYHDMNAWLRLVFDQLQQQKKGVPTQQA